MISLFLFLSSMTTGFTLSIISKPSTDNSLQKDSAKPWTLMIYLDGDVPDLEDEIVSYINEMEKVGSSSNINVIVQADDYLIWGKETRRYYIQRASNQMLITSPLADESTEERDMGASNTLVNFVLWSMVNYPAQIYCLIIFDHGYGWKGFCTDVTNGSKMDMLECEDALQDVYSVTGEKIDIMIYEACQMGMIEACYQIKDFVSFYVASEKQTNAFYFSFENILQSFSNHSSESSKSSLTQRVVDGCYCQQNDGKRNHRLFGVDMSRIQELKASINSIALAGESLLATAGKFPIKNAHSDSLVFTGDVLSANPHDIMNIINSFKVAFSSNPEMIDTLDEAMNNIKTAIIRPNEDDTNYVESCLNGLAICFPETHTYYDEGEYTKLAFAKETNWDEFLQNYFSLGKTHISFFVFITFINQIFL